MHTPEWFEKKAIGAHLDAIGAWHFKPTTMGFGGSGVPDIIFCYLGYFGSIEVKREGKEPTRLQEKRMEQIRMAKGAAFWGTADKVIPELVRWSKDIVSGSTASERVLAPLGARKAQSGK